LVISTELVHFNDGGIGLRFSGDKLRSFQQLEQARQRNTAVSEDAARQFVNGHRVVDQSQKIKILNACNDQLKSFLDEMLQEYLTQLDDVLLKEAGNQKNDAAQHPYFDAMAHYKRSRKSIPAAVVGNLIADAQDIVNHRFKPAATATIGMPGETALSLVEKND